MGRHFLQSSVTVCAIALLLLPSVGAGAIEPSLQPLEPSADLHLSRAETYLYITATEAVDGCIVTHVFPPDYQAQTPVFFDLLSDSTAPVLSVRIHNDSAGLNKVVEFTLGALAKDEPVLVHFNCWVLVDNDDYETLPSFVRFPRRCDLPPETLPWLAASDVVQSRNLFIRLKAADLQGSTHNLLRFAERAVRFTAWHRMALYILQLDLGLLKGQDAVTTLFRSGDCPGRSHFISALFRSQHVPCRSVMAATHRDYWVGMHFMAEYYCPGYGWILSEVHGGTTPYEAREAVVMRICTPDDEASTAADYVYPRMTGIERWIWTDTDTVLPYYEDYTNGSRMNMFPEGALTTDQGNAAYAMALSRMVFRLYQTYFGMNLSGDDRAHFEAGVDAMALALGTFASADLAGYLSFMNHAYGEFVQISP